MRHYGFSALIDVGALCLGVVCLVRGRLWLGWCLIGMAVLRALMLFRGRRPLNLESESRFDITKPSVLRHPKLPPDLKRQLTAITPSVDGKLKYHPCLVRLNDGTELDRVYVVSEAPYIEHWGVFPGQDRHKAEVLLSDVASLTESPSRLPARFANELYKAGESGMGYTLFRVVFSDGTRQAFLAGNAVDFIEYPPGKGPQDVTAVLPHEGRNEKGSKDAPKYRWCIYSE